VAPYIFIIKNGGKFIKRMGPCLSISFYEWGQGNKFPNPCPYFLMKKRGLGEAEGQL